MSSARKRLEMSAGPLALMPKLVKGVVWCLIGIGVICALTVVGIPFSFIFFAFAAAVHFGWKYAEKFIKVDYEVAAENVEIHEHNLSIVKKQKELDS